MVKIHFMEQDDPALMVLESILALAGPNYTSPYDSSAQPFEGSKLNDDDLLQYQLPAGISLKGYSDTSESKSMSSAINSLLLVLTPVLSAYGFLLPIFGVIIGILEVLCALMNPFAVKRAVKRLIKKWLPPLLSLFPPVAGVLIIASTIKVILAIVFFIMTVLIPMIKLFAVNIGLLSDANGENGNKQQRDAIREKLLTLITELANQLGIFSVIKPIVDLVMSILKLASKKPCKKKKKGKKLGLDPMHEKFDLTEIDSSYDEEESDTTCCDDEVCPPLLKSPPSGSAFILPAFYGNASPKFAWRIYPRSSQSDVISLIQYMQSFKAQLDSQLDEPFNEAKFAGQSSDTSHFSVKITGKRGSTQSVTLPISKINSKDGSMYVIDPALFRFKGSVTYQIITNWDMLIAHSVVSIACDPEIEAVKNSVYERLPDLDLSAVEQFPELADLGDELEEIIKYTNNKVNAARNEVVDVVFADPKPSGAIVSTDTGIISVPSSDLIDAVGSTDAKQPPYDSNINALNSILDSLINALNTYIDALKARLNSILSKSVDRVNSDFDVDKNLVKADGKNKAIVYVIPRDMTGSPILKNTPSGVTIDVSIFTDFGTLSNKKENKSTGTISAELVSFLPGVATLTATVNGTYIVSFDGENETTKEVEVSFVSDAIMPQRRLVSKPGKYITANNNEREPGRR